MPLGEQVYLQILQRIERGRFGPGARVRDADLASELGVSRTPVREALTRLAREGVLRAEAGRGFRLAPLDPGELSDVGAILVVLEPLALDRTPALPSEQVSRLTAIARELERTRGDVPACVDLDDEFHRVLLEGCPNRRLLALVETLRRGLRRYVHHYLEHGGRVSLSALPHSRIADALRRGDRDAARALLERKWRRGIEEIESALR